MVHHHRIKWEHKKVFALIVLWIFGYYYFKENSIDAFVTRLIQLPLIGYVVSSATYFIILIVLSVILWICMDKLR